MELRFKMTSFVCPEQYDVYDVRDDTQVGYVRLRHGYLSVRCPDHTGEEVYSAVTKADGGFYNERERKYHLTEAAKAIQHYHKLDNDFSEPGDFIISV